MKLRRWIYVFAYGVAMLGVGCRPDTARLDRNDRETSLFRKAVTCEKAGDLDAAIRLYGEALLDQARLASAHLQLALLLHDHRQDYTGAIYHYKSYLDLRPGTEKSELIQSRIRIAEQLLAAQLLRRVGGDVAGAVQAKQLADNEKLNKRIVALESEKTALLEAGVDFERQIKTLTGDVERLRRLLDRLQMPTTPAAEHQSRSSSLPRLTRSATVEPVPREQIAPVAPQVPLITSENTPDKAPVVTNREDDRLVAPQPLEASTPPPVAAMAGTKPEGEALLRDGAVPPVSTPRQPGMQTYVVQPGDTLFHIAEKIYGDAGLWKKLRDANRSRIDPDGRVRAGQILLVP